MVNRPSRSHAPIAVVLAAVAIASAAAAQAPGKAHPPTLLGVRGQTTCGVTGRTTVDAVIDGGYGGKGVVYVKSIHGAIASAGFTAEAGKVSTVRVDVADASCTTPGAFDVWLGTGGAHKGLVASSVTFVEGPAPGAAGPPTVVGEMGAH